ncbi:Rieske (2Fe-2S) protein [Aurantivibrio infirmus]
MSLPNDADLILCHISDIDPKTGKGFDQNGLQLFAIKTQKDFQVYLNRCPHVGLPLNWVADQFMDADGELIQCKSHGALFRIEDGQCVAGPCIGQSLQRIESHTNADNFLCVKENSLQKVK